MIPSLRKSKIPPFDRLRVVSEDEPPKGGEGVGDEFDN